MSLLDEIKASQPPPTVKLTVEGLAAYKQFWSYGRYIYSFEENLEVLSDQERTKWNAIANAAVASVTDNLQEMIVTSIREAMEKRS